MEKSWNRTLEEERIHDILVMRRKYRLTNPVRVSAKEVVFDIFIVFDYKGLLFE